MDAAASGTMGSFETFAAFCMKVRFLFFASEAYLEDYDHLKF